MARRTSVCHLFNDKFIAVSLIRDASGCSGGRLRPPERLNQRQLHLDKPFEDVSLRYRSDITNIGVSRRNRAVGASNRARFFVPLLYVQRY